MVLHDALLHHFYLGSFRKTEYADEFVFNYGEWNRKEAEVLWRDRAASAQDSRYFDRPMLKRIAQTALHVIVHNPAAARAVRQHSPETSVTEIPHFQDLPLTPDPREITSFRSALDIPENGFVFAVFGYLRESKRLLPILRAFSRLRQLQQNTYLLIAGEFVSQDLERAVATWISQPGIRRLPHLPERDFRLAAASVDCCLNLRYPTAGETSGIAMRLMAAGKPVIATEGEEWLRFDENSLLRIPAGPPESEALFEAMVLLRDHPELGRQIGRQAREHIQRYHSLSASAAEYWNLLCRTSESQS